MKRQKNCFLCNIPDNVQDELIRQRLLTKSDRKTFNWFQTNYPTAELKESTMVGHWRRHIVDSDKKKIKLEFSGSKSLASTELAPIIVKDGEIVIAPNVELVSLFYISLKRIKKLMQSASRDRDDDNQLMKWMAESRRLLELIEKTRKLPGQGVASPGKKEPSVDYMSQLSFEKGEYESLQQQDQPEANITEQ